MNPKNIFFIFTFFTYFFSNAQNIEFSQFLNIRNLELSNACVFLNNHQWKIIENIPPTTEVYGVVNFELNDSSKQKSHLSYSYGEKPNETRLLLQVVTEQKYHEYLNYLLIQRFKFIESRTEDGNQIKVYQGPKETVTVITSNNLNFYDYKNTSWYFMMVSNEDYDLENKSEIEIKIQENKP